MAEMNDPRIQNLNTQPAAGSSAVSRAKQKQAYHPAGGEKTFAETLSEASRQTGEVHFSNHAQKRLETRSINLSDDGLSRLAQAVDQASQRGSRESLVLMDDLAFIVNVRDRLVVTAVDLEKRGQGVFTQIDSVVIAEPGRTREA